MPDYQKYSDDDLKRHQKDIRTELNRRKSEDRKRDETDKNIYR